MPVAGWMLLGVCCPVGHHLLMTSIVPGTDMKHYGEDKISVQAYQ